VRVADPTIRDITWPDGKQFAFTVFDDTDFSTIETVGPIYRFLLDHGFLTTKTVWPLAPVQERHSGGGTLEEPCYRDWVLDLHRRGVEIAFHGATDHSSTRARTIAALDFYRQVLAQDARAYAMHATQTEAMYWGEARLDGSARVVYRALQRLMGYKTPSMGHVEGSPYFWGDLCQERITYARNLTFREINTLRRDPMMPYHDPRRPYIPYWFSCSDGAHISRYCQLINERNQDRLAEEGGACIVYTHFANGFCESGRPHSEFFRLMQRLANLPGWFVPASTVLDHIRTQPHWKEEVDERLLRRIQWRWLIPKLRYGCA
jgi:hypothetical protein